MDSNLRIYKTYRIFLLTMITDPIFILYAMNMGLSATQIFLLTGIHTAFVVLLEVPTGIISDMYGYKISIVLGIISFISANLIYLFVPCFAGFLISEILVALYKVMLSGADEAYLFLELSKNNSCDDFAEVNGSVDSIMFVLTAIASVSIGHIYSYNTRLPFLMSVVFCTISLIFSLKLENLKESENKSREKRQIFKEFIITAKTGFIMVLKNSKIKWFVGYSTVIGFSLVAIMNMYQIYFVKSEIPPKFFGWIYFCYYLISSIGSRFAYKLKKFNIYKVFALLLCLLITVPLLMIVPMKIMLIATVIPRIVIGIYPALIREFMNREIISNSATVFSIRSLLMRITQIFLLPILGIIIDKCGLNYGLISLSILILALSLLKLKLTGFKSFDNADINVENNK